MPTPSLLPACRIPLLAGLLLLALAPSASSDAGAPGKDDIAKARTQTQAGAKALIDGQHARAKEAFQAALALVPASPEAKRNLALAHARLGQSALAREAGGLALEHYERALELHPRRIRYEIGRAEALLILGRTAEALQGIEPVVARAPRYIEGWILKSDIDEARGELTDAVDALKRAVALAPSRRRSALAQELVELERRAKTEAGFLTHATGNFVARYGPDADPGTVRLALTLLEDAYSRVTADLGVSPRTPARVILYEGNEFQATTGAHGWVGALYVNGTLRVPIRNLERHQEIAARLLSHEFTHHVLRQATPGLPTWWHEGIAQHEESKTERKERQFRALLEQMKRLEEKNALLSLSRMQNTHVANVSDVGFVTLYYGQARAFVDWLVAEHGSGALPSFLVALGKGRDTSAACKTAFGRTEADLWKAWRQSLR